jgi:hypothetical protein
LALPGFGPAGAWPALLVAMLLLLAGCGPGLGGTGTGEAPVPGANVPGGFSASSLCDEPLGAALGCAPGATASGSPGSTWVDTITGGQRQLQTLGNAATWRDNCAALLLDGVWGRDGAGTLRYWGSTLADGASEREPGSLALALQPDGSLVAQRFDAADQAVGAALPLRRARVGDPPPAPCGG